MGKLDIQTAELSDFMNSQEYNDPEKLNDHIWHFEIGDYQDLESEVRKSHLSKLFIMVATSEISQLEFHWTVPAAWRIFRLWLKEDKENNFQMTGPVDHLVNSLVLKNGDPDMQTLSLASLSFAQNSTYFPTGDTSTLVSAESLGGILDGVTAATMKQRDIQNIITFCKLMRTYAFPANDIE